MGLRWQNSATNIAALQQVTNKTANGNILKDKGHKKPRIMRGFMSEIEVLSASVSSGSIR
ncbi:hypothetical protein OUHCRE2_32240 [Enterobacter asburiae]|nr:hypothetical protein TUM17556_32830 [Enterobacter asburiae]